MSDISPGRAAVRSRFTAAAALLLVAALAWPASADVFRILDDDREAAQARVDIIQNAEREIHALYFLARNDRITLAALALLRDAKRCGVGSVKLVVDANFHRIPKGVLAHLRDEGVEVRVFHPLKLRHPSWLFRRMHEKVVVVDGERYIAGGRNLAESYFGISPGRQYVDRDVYVEGSSAVDAVAHFDRVWSSRHVAVLKVRVTAAEKRRAALLLDRVLRDLQKDGFIELHTGRDWSVGQKEVDSVRLLHDPVAMKGPRVAIGLARILETARTSVVIESPYLVPSKTLLEILDAMLARGVSITILTNSLKSTDGALPQAGYLKYRRRLARAGVDLREYKGPDSLHAKSMVVDDRIALIGSYNIDPRSQNLNTEVMCVTEDEEAAALLTASIESHLKNSWQIGPDGTPPRDPAYPGVDFWKSVRVRLYRLVMPLVEKQL